MIHRARLPRFTWSTSDLVPVKSRSVSLGAALEEFYNKCHSTVAGKFCNTAGTGNVKDTPAKKAAAKASDAKKGLGPSATKTPAKTAPKKKVAVKSKAVVKAAPKKAIKKATPGKKVETDPMKMTDKQFAAYHLAKMQEKIYASKGKKGKILKVTSGTTKKVADNDESPEPKVTTKSKTAAKVAPKKVVAKTENDMERYSRMTKSWGIDDFMGGPNGLNETPPPRGVPRTPMSDEQFGSVLTYRSQDYQAINLSLRNGTHSGLDLDPMEIDGTIDLLDSVFKNAPRTTETITVQRAVRLGRESLGDDFVDNSYVSTAYDKAGLANFSPNTKGITILTIKIPAGSKAIKVSGSEGKGEGEILLPRGSRFVKGKDGVYVVATNEDPDKWEEYDPMKI